MLKSCFAIEREILQHFECIHLSLILRFGSEYLDAIIENKFFNILHYNPYIN